MKRKIVIGITGGFGTGKSTVARMFEGLGAIVIDADRIAHDIILPGKPAYKKLVSLFGTHVLRRDGIIDRKKLGSVAFNDLKALFLLNSIVHPEVIDRIRKIVKKRRHAVYIIDAPLLIEADLLDMIDMLTVVTTNRKTQIKRCRRQFGISRAEIIKRIRSQMPLSKKRRFADFIIDNNGSLGSTRKRVKKIWRDITNG